LVSLYNEVTVDTLLLTELLVVLEEIAVLPDEESGSQTIAPEHQVGSRHRLVRESERCRDQPRIMTAGRCAVAWTASNK
jgi:hypothetical protein